MGDLGLKTGDVIDLESASIRTGEHVRQSGEQVTITLRPHDTKFSELACPKVVLEIALSRGHTCLTQGNTITVFAPGIGNFKLDVEDVSPGGALCIINCTPVLHFRDPFNFHSRAIALKPGPRV